tara:strand:- start:24092 stop:24784 length:693 start_codon:yes stop_codon:yes gene_type:complete
MINYEAFLENYKQLQASIAKVCSECGRSPETVKVTAVTKNNPADCVEYAHKAGLFAVGENRIQEAQSKKEELQDNSIRWELVGHLQSNKAKKAIELFDRIQTVDSFALAQRIDRIAGELGIQQAILLQFNTGEDPKKFGATQLEAHKLVESVLTLKNIKLEGLMTIAPIGKEEARVAFKRLANLKEELESTLGVTLPELSMGMSGDFEEAIAAGSTLIRVGTYLFGERSY